MSLSRILSSTSGARSSGATSIPWETEEAPIPSEGETTSGDYSSTVGDAVPDLQEDCDRHQLIHLHLPATVRVRGKKNCGKTKEGPNETREAKKTTERSIKRAKKSKRTDCMDWNLSHAGRFFC